jgi:hypothetical protein
MRSESPPLFPVLGLLRRNRVGWLAAALAAWFTTGAVALQAQNSGTLGGQVVDAKNLRGLDGAQILVQGTGIGTLTDGSGGFRLTGLTGSTVTLQVRRIGYKPLTQQATVGRADVRILLTEQLNSLSEVVITGTAEPVEKRAIGNSVTKIDAASVQNIAPAADVSSLLNGRAAGVVLTGGSGAVGSGPRIRIRGAASLSLSDQPLIYLDGIRIANDVSSGPRSSRRASSPASTISTPRTSKASK